MNIFMTGNAFSFQAKEGVLAFFQILIPDQSWLMAIRATLFLMGALKNESGNSMVKFFPVETNELKIQPMMVGMATGAWFSFDDRSRVVAQVLLDPAFNLGVAGQTAVVGNLFAQQVTFCAVRQALQM